MTAAETFNVLLPLKQVGFGVAVVLLIVGLLFTTTTVLLGALVQPAAVAVNTYVPSIAKVAVAETLGFWLLLAKPLGPVQLKVVPLSVVPVRFSGEPTHTGLLLPAVAVGVGFTVTTSSFE
jgi:hypothetical protein